MRVGLVVPGGVDRSGEYRVIPCLLWLIERLARSHEVHVFALRQEPGPVTYPLAGATVHVIGKRPERLRLARAILTEHRRAPFHVLHAVWAVPSGVVAGAVGRILGVPVLLHLTGGDLADLPAIGYGARQSWTGRRSVELAIRAASQVTTPSVEMQRTARRFGVTARRLPFGVALDRWPPCPPRRRDRSAPARLVHVASLNRVKDQGTLVEAIGRLRDRGIAFHLDIAGADTLDGEIQARCGKLGLDGEVTFHGFLPHRELRPIVERSHILVVSSLHEADPVAMLEAAAVGVPTVSTAVGHAVDWQPDRAIAVPVADPAGLADAVADLLADEDRRLAVAAEAQRRALCEDADWTARTVIALYEKMASDR